MTAVHHILDQKGHQVWSVHPADTVYDAIRMMADKNVGSLVVLDGSKIVGIVTERHYARNVFLKGRASPQTRVDEIMERNVVCVEPDQSIEERAGPGCLNRISASISGASAGVRPPSGMAAG